MARRPEGGLATIVRSLGNVLPDGFRRRGRKWLRVTTGVQQELRLRRLHFSDGTGVVMFRRSFSADRRVDG